MEELFNRLNRYGPGWTLMFHIGENNSITMVLEHMEPRMTTVSENYLFSNDMVVKLRDAETHIINVLDSMHQRASRRLKG